MHASAEVMNLYAAGSFSILLLNGILWYFIILNRKRDAIVAAYLLWSSCVAIWSIGYGITLSGWLSYGHTLWWNKICHAFAALIPVAFVNLVFALTERSARKSKTFHLILVTGLGLSALAISPYLISELWQMNGFRYQPLGYQPAYFLFTLFFWVTVIYGLWLLLKRSLVLNGTPKEQIRIFLAGSAIGYGGGSTLFMQGFGFPLLPTGVFFISFYVLFTGYAIYRYGFMNLELIIRKTAVFTGLFASLYIIFATFLSISKYLFEELFGWNIWVSVIPAFAVFIALYRPLEKALINATDKFLFQKKFDYKTILVKFIDEIITELDLSKIIEKTEYLINSLIHPENFRIYLLDKHEDAYTVRSAIASNPIRGENPIVKALKLYKEPLLITDKRAEPALVEALKAEKALLAVPLEREEEFLGFVLMGKKKSDEDYNQDDVVIFDSLSKTLAVAIVNAHATDELAEAKSSKYLAAMADGMSHQFKNRFQVISSVLGLEEFNSEDALDQAKAAGNPDERIRILEERVKGGIGAFRKATENCVAGGEIANTILNFSRPDRKKNFNMNHLSQAAEKAINMIELLNAGNDKYKLIRITHVPNPDLPKTWSSMSSLSEAVFNAVQNSVESILKKSGPATDSCLGRIDIAEIHRPESGVVRIVIKDDGCGIKPHHLDSVRAGVPGFTTKGTSDQKSGYGMGVHMIKEFIKLHQGRVYYESEWGKGTTCTIEVPLRTTPAEEAETV